MSTNDALGNNARNLGQIMNIKYISCTLYQDDPLVKNNSLIADMDMIVDTILLALKGKQIHPVIIEKRMQGRI